MNSVENARLIDSERRLPGLALVLDPARVQEYLSAHGTCEPGDRVELDYVRYKPGRRALALMNIVDRSGSTRPVVVSAHDPEGWDKFVATGQAADVASHGGLTCPEHRTSLELFPYDRRLRQIAKLCTPARTNTMLQRITGIALPATETWNLQMLAYKPRRRFVVRASSSVATLAVKFYAAEDFDQACSKAGGVAHPELQPFSPKMFSHNDRYSAIASQWIDGETLAQRMSSGGHWESCVNNTGAMLANWQHSASEAMGMIATRHNGFTVEALQNLARDVAWILPELQLPVQDLLRELQPFLAELRSGNDLIHGDFYAKQVIVQDDAVKLIDFDEIGRGHRYQDLGSFVGQLYWNALRGEIQLAQVATSIDHLVAGYAGRLGQLNQPLLHASIAVGILRCMPHPFRRGLDDWSGKMQQMFEWCCQWLDRISTAAATYPNRSQGEDQSSDKECSPYLNGTFVEPYLHNSSVALTHKPPRGGALQARLLRHKPGRRLLVEYKYVSNNDDTCLPAVLGKSRFTKAVDQRVLQLHRDLQSLPAGDVYVPQVLGVVPELNMWLQEKVDGHSVSPESDALIHAAVGRAIAELHNSTACIARFHTIADELETLRKQHAQWLGPNSPWHSASQAVLALAEEYAGLLKASEPVLLHRDFYFDQVLSMESGIALLDFDLAAMGPAELDVGNYLAHLDEHALRHAQLRDQCQSSGDAFIAEYRCVRKGLSLDNVKVWRFLSLARLAAISQRIESRSSHTGLILEYCLTCKAFQNYHVS